MSAIVSIDRRGIADAPGVIGKIAAKVVAPRIGTFVLCATGGFFPFGFGGQAGISPLALGFGHGPVDIENGIIREGWIVVIGRPRGRPWLFGQFAHARRYTCGIHVIRDFVFIHVKGFDVDFAGGAFFCAAIVIAHGEFAGRDEAHGNILLVFDLNGQRDFGGRWRFGWLAGGLGGLGGEGSFGDLGGGFG